jgi:hypothetical protein
MTTSDRGNVLEHKFSRLFKSPQAGHIEDGVGHLDGDAGRNFISGPKKILAPLS